MISVVKIGGAVVENEEALQAFCRDFAALEGPKLLVHGGGVMASRLQEALGRKPLKVEGRRVTDADTLKTVTMVYSGWCNKHVCALLQACGCNAIGLSGCDGNAIRASRRAPRTLEDGITVVDYGFVGDVTPESVNIPFIQTLLDAGLTPVFCAINHDGQGNLLNTNADTIASSLAAALKARLICCFELDGVLSDRNDSSSLIRNLTPDGFSALKSSGAVSEGMIPKIENCLEALRDGAAQAVIKNSNALGDAGAGTFISL